MQKSENPLDLALSKEGLFFLVKTPDGIRMTRDGSFTTDNDGKLVTKDGYEVLPSDYFESKRPIIIPVQSSAVEIEKSGQISTTIVGSAKLAPLAKLFIFQPDNIDMIKKDAANLYRYDNKEQTFTNAQNMEAVSQGFVEKSNVNPIKMMSALIETHRLVEMYQKAMDSQMNDMNRDAIEKLAKRS
jgi:flagellar basal-body rod protein FlgG